MYALSDSEMRRYREDGYLVPGFRLSGGWLTRLRAALDRLLESHPRLSADFVPSPHVPNYVPGVVEYEE